MTGQAHSKIDQLRQLAALGKTRNEIASEMGVSYCYVVVLAKAARICVARQKYSGAERADSDRVRTMAELYKGGRTLEQIGDRFGITRERVRQILTKHLGFNAKNGGGHVRGQQKQLKYELKKNQKSFERWGCSWQQYADLKDIKKPTRAFAAQKRNAKKRGIDWHLSLWDWWSIWQQSGRWDERGRGHGFQMCRIGDQGPYSIDNVYIASGAVNIQDYWADVKSGTRTRTLSPRSKMAPERARELQRAAVARYRDTPRYQLRYELRRQGVPKDQRDAIVAQRFGDAR